MIAKNRTLIGGSFCVFYGLILYYVFEKITPFGATLVSLSYFFIVPFILGYVRVRFVVSEKPKTSIVKSIVIAWQPLLIILLVSIVTLQEGSICVIIALPVFMVFSGLGGMLARIVSLHLLNKATTVCIALLPFLFAPIESQLPQQTSIYSVNNLIIINAEPEVIWKQLTEVSEIDENELSFGITRFIGVPRPIKAQMNGNDVGAIRTSTWDKGVVFQEVITDWSPNHLMAYNFKIDPKLIPDTAMDEHVKMGGAYFSPVYGNYELVPNENGTTTLSLSTTIRDNTRFGIYSRLWGHLIFSDFHTSLLKLIKQRSEQ